MTDSWEMKEKHLDELWIGHSTPYLISPIEGEGYEPFEPIICTSWEQWDSAIDLPCWHSKVRVSTAATSKADADGEVGS